MGQPGANFRFAFTSSSIVLEPSEQLSLTLSSRRSSSSSRFLRDHPPSRDSIYPLSNTETVVFDNDRHHRRAPRPPPCTLPTSLTPAATSKSSARHHRRLPPRSFSASSTSSTPSISKMVSTTPASQPLLLRYHVNAPAPRPASSRPTPPCPRQPRHRRHCSSDATGICTNQRHVSGESPRRLCTASSCLGSVTMTARSPAHPPPTRSVRVFARVPPPTPPRTLLQLPFRKYFTAPGPKRPSQLQALHNLPKCAGVYPRLSSVWSSPGSAAASDLERRYR